MKPLHLVVLLALASTPSFANVHYCSSNDQQVTLVKDEQGVVYLDNRGNITPILQSRGLERLQTGVQYVACYNPNTGRLSNIQEATLE